MNEKLKYDFLKDMASASDRLVNALNRFSDNIEILLAEEYDLFLKKIDKGIDNEDN